MHWLFYLTIFVIFFSIKDIIRKRSLNRFDNMAVLSIEFTSAFVLFTIVSLVLRIPLSISSYTVIFFGLGLLHGLGTVGKINAMNISLSKTTLISKYNVLIPMLLGIFFLGEGDLLNPYSTPGFLKLIAVILFPISLFLLQKDSLKVDKKISLIWIASMAQYFIFHATLDFFIKLNVQPDMLLQAAVFQRMGAASVTILAAIIGKARFPLTKQLFGVSIGNGVLITIAFFATLSALTTAPLVIYKPLEKMLTLVIITFFGLFVFGEHKEITEKTKWGYITTGLGVVLLVIAEAFELF